MTKMPRLSSNEQLVLYGISRYPGFNDRRISEVLDLKPSTVTSIKNRLKKEGYIIPVRVPSLQRLGCELLCAGHFRLNRGLPRELVIKSIRDIVVPREEVFLAFTDCAHLFVMSLCEKYSDALDLEEHCHAALREKNLLAHEPQHTRTLLLPLDRLELLNIFNAPRLLRMLFKLDIDDKDTDLGFVPPLRSRNLSPVERRVMCGLVEFPDLLDNAISSKIGVTRQTVTKIRRRLESEKLILSLRFPDFIRLGMELLLVANYTLEPKTSKSGLKSVVEWLSREAPPILQVRCGNRGIILGLAGDYKTIYRAIQEISRKYSETGLLRGDPELQIFSVPDMTVFKFLDFGPITKKILLRGIEKKKLFP